MLHATTNMDRLDSTYLQEAEILQAVSKALQPNPSFQSHLYHSQTTLERHVLHQQSQTDFTFAESRKAASRSAQPAAIHHPQQNEDEEAQQTS